MRGQRYVLFRYQSKCFSLSVILILGLMNKYVKLLFYSSNIHFVLVTYAIKKYTIQMPALITFTVYINNLTLEY